MKVAINNEVHAVTNPYKTVCGLTVAKRHKPTAEKLSCPICEVRESKRTEEIATYIQKLMDNNALPLNEKMWRLVGFVEQGVRE